MAPPSASGDRRPMSRLDMPATTDRPGAPVEVADERLSAALALSDPFGVESVYGGAHGGPPRRGAHGRAVFTALGSGRVVDVPLPVTVPAFTALDRFAHVRPLLHALDMARPAGLVQLTASRLAVIEVGGLVLRELAAVELARPGRRGQPDPETPFARGRGPARDLHGRRRRARLRAATADFALRVGALARARAWDVVAVTGAMPVLDDFARRFRCPGTELVLPATPIVRSRAVRAAEEIARARTARSAARSARATADPMTIWGRDGVLGALGARRVAEVLLAGDLRPADAERAIREAVAAGARVTLSGPGTLGRSRIAATARW
jgi:hypothetical protein